MRLSGSQKRSWLGTAYRIFQPQLGGCSPLPTPTVWEPSASDVALVEHVNKQEQAAENPGRAERKSERLQTHCATCSEDKVVSKRGERTALPCIYVEAHMHSFGGVHEATAEIRCSPVKRGKENLECIFWKPIYFSYFSHVDQSKVDLNEYHELR
jgi:hypothetical protein